MNQKEFNDFVSRCQQIENVEFKRQQQENVHILRVRKTNQLITMKCFPNQYYESQEQLQQMIETLKRQKQLCHDNLITVMDYFYGEQVLMVFTQYCSHSLLDEIEVRKRQGNYFTLQQIENIVISICKALKYLQEHQIGHGCISPVDILVSQKGSIKLIDPSLASNSPFDITHGYYYSPQLLKLNILTINANSNNSLSNTDINFFSSDVFVLGIVLLHLGLLKDMSQCFNYYTATLSINQIRKNIIQFQQIYGPQMAHLANQMLSVDQAQRISPVGILKFIEEQYDDSDQQSERQDQYQDPQSYSQQYFEQNSQKYKINKKISLRNNFKESFNRQNMYTKNISK